MSDGTPHTAGRSRFVSNTVALAIQTVAATVLTLAQVKILSNSISKEDFGLFASLRGFSLLLSTVAASGFPQLLLRFIPVHETARSLRSAAGLSAASLGAATVFLVLFCGLVVAVRDRALAFAGGSVFGSELWFWFLAVTFGVMIKQVLYGGFNGLRKLALQSFLETIALAVILAWIAWERGRLSILLLFEILGVVHVATAGVSLFAYSTLLARMRSGEERAERPPDRGRGGVEPRTPAGRLPGLRDYRGYFAWSAGLSLVAVAFSDVDRYLLAQVLTLEVLALFHIGARVGRLANRLLGVASLAFHPEVTRLDAEGRREGVVFATRLFMKLSTALAALVTCGLIVFARDAVVLVASPEYAGAAPLLVFFALSLPFTTLTAPVTAVMKAIDQVRGALLVDLVWALTYVALMIVLGSLMGLVGTGLANLAACVLQLLAAVLTSRVVGLGFVAGVLSRLGGAAVMAFGPALVVGPLAEGAWSAGLVLAARILLFGAGAAALPRLLRGLAFFSPSEKDAMAGILARRGLKALARLL